MSQSVRELIEEAQDLATLDGELEPRQIADPLSAMPDEQKDALRNELQAVAQAQQDAFVGLSDVVVR